MKRLLIPGVTKHNRKNSSIGSGKEVGPNSQARTHNSIGDIQADLKIHVPLWIARIIRGVRA